MIKFENDKAIVFFDFDNTITEFDVIDDLLLRFSRNDRWKELEERWKKREIGSRECLKGQIEGMSVTKKELDSYLTKVRIDPYFKKLQDLLDSNSIKTFILSDDFDYIIKNILTNNGARHPKIFSNKLRFSKDRIIPDFKLSDDKCSLCAHCKKKSLFSNGDADSVKVYVGDGLSDVCPAEHVDLVFAKEDLLDHCKEKGLEHIPYKNMKDVYKYFKEELL